MLSAPIAISISRVKIRHQFTIEGNISNAHTDFFGTEIPCNCDAGAASLFKGRVGTTCAHAYEALRRSKAHSRRRTRTVDEHCGPVHASSSLSTDGTSCCGDIALACSLSRRCCVDDGWGCRAGGRAAGLKQTPAAGTGQRRVVNYLHSPNLASSLLCSL